MSLFLQAWFQLLRIEPYLRKQDFKGLYQRVRGCAIRPPAKETNALSKLCEAMDMACIWYWRQALCLQRSAALACLLKRHGISAEMVIGAQQMPFRSHAWVEVEGRVVNDKAYVGEVFAVLDRC